MLVNGEKPRVLLVTIPDEQREDGEGAESDEDYMDSEPFHRWLEETHGVDVNEVEWMSAENIILDDKRESDDIS